MKNDRTKKIMELLRRGKTLQSQELAGYFGVSAATIRRDFDQLVGTGLVRRFYGGIAPAENYSDPALPLSMRESWETGIKQKLAMAAMQEIPEGGTLFIDGGTTTAQLGRFLTSQKLRIITNSTALLHTISELPEPHASLILTGGLYNHTSGILLGQETVNAIRSHCTDMAIISGTALDADWVYDNREDAAAVQRAMIENSSRLLVIADSSKIGSRAFCKSFPVEKISVLITNFDRENHPVIAALRRKNIRIVTI